MSWNNNTLTNRRAKLYMCIAGLWWNSEEKIAFFECCVFKYGPIDHFLLENPIGLHLVASPDCQYFLRHLSPAKRSFLTNETVCI